MCEAILIFVLSILPAPLESLACPPVNYAPPEEMPIPGASGVYDKGTGEITIDSSLPPDRREVTLAHELVHWLVDQVGQNPACHAEEAIAYYVGLVYATTELDDDSPYHKLLTEHINLGNPLDVVQYVALMANRSCSATGN